ncbi:hypothetical protein W02_11950 [Nitrospira sp. KM1]|uniref:SAM hydrolase/SAM-dependent halogenase family protein n=1 Tax=Nitrospira sp. KM1 TaxID=1936990 RepID=UPI0013A73413|nr:SAM-dependent chlorinase/fluorinase [Nitrospira sp. KM1]BCA54055.1 hypothetical protein W02_11950 [Nitrospira sp. KM1]
MTHPLGIITLLTDFGDHDWFVASMKGVILSINPQATIIDLAHRVTPHAVDEGAFLLKSCYRYFPPGTVHVAVIDPGVGGARLPLIVKTPRYFFLAPDNGVLTHVLAEEGEAEVREIRNKQYSLEPDGQTFDGRDVFAPAAAWLTKQQSVASYGPVLQDYVSFPVRVPQWQQQALVGEVVHVDRFGNLITNFTMAHVREVQELTKRPNPSIRIGGYVIDGLVRNYEAGDAASAHALMNSDGRLEVFLKQGSAASSLNVAVREPVRLS